MKYIYHYHAKQKDSVKVTDIDGIIECNVPITSMERYNELKEIIIKDLHLNTYHGLIVTSFSLLHTLDD